MVSGVGEEADAGLVEEPAVATDERLFTRLAQRQELRGLHPAPEHAHRDAGVFQGFVVSAQVLRRWALGENLQRPRPFAAPRFDHRLDERRARKHSQKNDNQETAGRVHQNWK